MSSALSRTIASTDTLKIAGIHVLDLFYTPLEERFERLTRLARPALGVPVAAITVLSHEKQWFKSVAGWVVSELPLERSLCRWTIHSGELLVLEDTRRDQRTAQHPLVVAAPHFRFYAGYPIKDEHGTAGGTLCVFDVKPRCLSREQRQSLLDLGALAQRELLSDSLAAAQSALVSKLGAARREAMIDPLTRLWNRRGASMLLQVALEDSQRDGTPIAVAMLDLDNFKIINDKHGHQVGDEALRKSAARLVASVRSDDPVCRFGGDEFLVIMPRTDALTCQQIMKRLIHALADSPIPTRAGRIPIRLSVGYTVRDDGESVTAEQLLERADRALMRSKSEGRNCVRAAS